MEWGHTNIANLPRNWSERPRPSHRSFAHNKGGVPPEHMVLLANMVGASPWFSIPHTADEDYQRQFAALVKASLRPDVKVYVEYSNEVGGQAGGQAGGWAGGWAGTTAGFHSQQGRVNLCTSCDWRRVPAAPARRSGTQASLPASSPRRRA